MIRAQDYTYRVFWSEEDGTYVATVAEFPSLSNVEGSQEAAFFGMVDLVCAVLADMQESGEDPPLPLGSRKYSGKYALRMSPEQHRRVAIEAAEQHVSINQLLVSRI
ncbi:MULTISPECIES: type II toxin-antitoxin system HicB family antitoxin [unclassified Adlercreutzia]|uniref:type II toxin-antitoxin system HicB family antitoxin n=1 Tax=unclassified Adlercreutzia TaxID=2636013 RepID=UPI0013EDD3B8|nr:MULTISPECIES: toxin-antitoxin system HicB family antitoxin [unclassified Adlercreutzia]